MHRNSERRDLDGHSRCVADGAAMKRALVVVVIVLAFVAIAWLAIRAPASTCREWLCPPPD